MLHLSALYGFPNTMIFFLPIVRTTMAQTRSCASIGPFFGTAFHALLRSSILSAHLSSSFSRLKSYLFLELNLLRALLIGLCREKRYLNTYIQHNTIWLNCFELYPNATRPLFSS